jgi:hypothetical protein
MNRLHGLSSAGRLLLAVVVGGVTFGIASAVQASIPDANGVIHGYYNISLAHGSPLGALRVIDTAKINGNCASWESPLNWEPAWRHGSNRAEGCDRGHRSDRPHWSHRRHRGDRSERADRAGRC